MKVVSLVAFDQFTDIDLFLPWDLFSRVGKDKLKVQILAKTDKVCSITGISIQSHASIVAAEESDAVYFCSGWGTRLLADEPDFCTSLKLDPQRQILAAIDSGAILLAKLGHLRGLRATTYPSDDLYERLLKDGVTPVTDSLVIEGNIATAAQCLAAVELVRWVLTRLFDTTLANDVLATAKAL